MIFIITSVSHNYNEFYSHKNHITSFIILKLSKIYCPNKVRRIHHSKIEIIIWSYRNVFMIPILKHLVQNNIISTYYTGI